MPKIHFLPSDITVDVKSGVAVLDAALDNNIHLDHNCGGNCACSTCHIIITEGFESLYSMTEDEQDMLDEAEGLTKTSRLSCQAILADKDLVVTIPNKDLKWDDDTF